MKLSQIQQQFSFDVVKLFLFMKEEGFFFTFGETYRTPEQAEIYEKEGKGIKSSLHCKRLAIDINLFNDKGEFLSSTKDHEMFGRYWESLNPKNRWGGNFSSRKDGNHYERNE